MASLQGSCRTDALALDAFVTRAAAALHTRAPPRSARELADVSAAQRALQDAMPEMENTVEDLKRKSHMLRTWGGDASADETIKEWQKTKELMLSHQKMFEHQAELVKSSLTGEWENLNTTVEAWMSRWKQNKARFEETHGASYAEMADRCRSVFEAHAQWDKFVVDRDELLKECEKFNLPLNSTDMWSEAEKLMTEYINIWTVLKDYDEEFQAINEQEWIIFQKKLHLLDDFVSKWNGKLEPYTAVTLYLQQELDKYLDLPMLLKYLRGSDFTERHWREIFSLLEMDYKKPDSLQVKDFLTVSPNIKKQIKALQKLCTLASSEAAVRTALNELELWFAGARLSIIYYNDKLKRPTPIVKDFKDILTKIEEQQWVVSSVSGGGGGDACAAWETRLRAARTLLKAAHHSQRRWLYLEPILSNDDGELGTKFRKVDQGFRQVTRVLEGDSRLSALLQSTRLQPMLDSISEQLQTCQSALNQYIDEKRSIFPRLYFLSDDDLLELLGQARAGAEGREAVMQTHLKKLFPGITGVRLGPEDMSVTALCSQYDEILQLDHPVDIDCPVEIWLKNLENEMRSSLQNMAMKCVVTSSLQVQDPFTLPTQILCLAQNIRFTEQTERAITAKELHKLKINIEKENSYYATTEIEDESERYKRQALILQCAHYMTVIQSLIDNNVATTSDWLWQKQLRFYLLSTKEIVAKMGLAQVSYSYEYLGVSTGQFVRTELADECFLILTQALHFGLVGNPFGPAGTGKTESVKALGSLVGRLVLIFNCDEAMDSECMGRLLTGLALCGAWGCFDEFNRLSAPTLAAVSHQLASLLPAMEHSTKNTDRVATLNGKQITVSPWCGVAATMNPVGRGYGGRRALPAALQRALRPVAMLQPAARPLAAHLLAARAVPHAPALAARLHDAVSLASHLLSNQRHYDWGLRALKAAVGSCGAALAGRADRAAQQQAARRVLELNNISKLTAADALRFEKILSMVFADVPKEEQIADPVCKALESTFDPLNLIYNKSQVQKCTEVYEQLQQRMGVAIVGPPGSGKTTIRRLLKSALTSQGKNIVEYVICPKAMSRNCLLGQIDHDTRQWTDGVISATALEISNQPPDVWSWVVCDGDIDPEWIEALNSVLDDNRLLTLPSGWRIQFGSNVNFIFETHSLEHASPATVSRMGIILLSDESSCGMEVLENWVRKMENDNDTSKVSVPLLQQAISRCLKWFNVNRSNVILKTCDFSVVKQIITQFEYLMQNTTNTLHRGPEEMVYLAIERSVTGILRDNSVDSFHHELSDILGPSPTIVEGPGEWVSDGLYLSPRLAAVEPQVRACVLSQNAHLLLIGPDACAKSALIEYVLKETNSTVITIDCTPILEPADIISALKRNNAVRSGGGYGTSESGERVALVVRSLHRASTDSWGCSAVHQFLLQLIQHGGFWSGGGEEGGGWSRCARVCVLAAAAAPPPAPRLAAALAHHKLHKPDDEELLELANNFLKQSVDKNVSVKDVNNLAKNMLSMFKEVTETFFSQPHYKWNAEHLKQWCENVKWYSATNATELLMAIDAEAVAIFRDRLITDDEKHNFDVISRNYLKSNITEPIYFIPKLKVDGIYMEVVERNEWSLRMQKLINQCLTENENVFGDSGAEVCSELATFCSAAARACRGGDSVGLAALVGSAGSGRRAAALLTAALLPASLITIEHQHHFYSHMKNALNSAGEGNRTLVLICESAAAPSQLSAIEALYVANSTHMIPSPMMPTQNSPNMLQNIKQNLGIAICLDKDQENIWELLERYPFLYTAGHVAWVERWSGETLRQMPPLVVQRLVKESLADVSKEDISSVPTEGFVQIHDTLNTSWSRAPCRYINFIKTYFCIVNKKKEALTERQNMLSAGVEALRRARSEVATLQAEAGTQQLELSEKQTSANRALEQIAATVRANTDQREEMTALKKNIELENDKLQIRKKEIEDELASVEPIIAAARSAVGDIRPESLSEIRSLRAPPDVVRDVLEGVLRLMGIADTSWHSMKNFLSKRGVKEDIRCLDASQISAEAAESVEKLLKTRGASFEAATAKRASAACAPLAAWVRANLAYAGALARVRPLQRQQTQLLGNLRAAEEELTALSSGLASVEERVGALQQQLGRHTRDAAALELSLAAARRTIAAATALIDTLAAEYRAWEHDLEMISKEILNLNSRSLLAAAYIVYLPDVTEQHAKEQLEKWGALIGFDDDSFSVLNFLSTTEKQLRWEADGLPTDTSAIKNAVLIDQVLQDQRCGFTPLIIDPDGEAMVWLKNTLAGTQFDFVSQHSEKLLTTVQYAARLGRGLVITDVDGASALWAALGAQASTARVLLMSRDAALPARLPPHRAQRLSVLPFTARREALADQLVYYALQQLNPEVNDKSKEIKLKKATLRKEQYELQENLLRDLSSNKDILHDANLVTSLDKMRETGSTIAAALAAAQEIAASTRVACDAYRASAARVAELALAVKRLATHRPLLSLPVDVLLDVYVDALRRGDIKNVNNDEVIKYTTRRIIERVLLGLHKKDKYIIVLHILKQVYPDAMSDKLWNLFLGNIISNDDQKVVNEMKKSYPWIPEDRIKKVVLLKAIDEDLFNKLSLGNTDVWKEFLASGDLNAISRLQLSAFETVVGVAILHPDALYRAIVAFVDQLLGAGWSGGAAGVACAARWCGSRRALRPALLLAAHAADVLAAHARAHRAALAQVGVEEGPAAWTAALESARQSSGWLALVVGASPFTSDLQNFIQTFVQSPIDSFNEEFRFWIISEDREIPPAIANVCVNVILEAPEGVKHNVLSTLAAWGNYEADPTLVRLHACLALFHALVQERRAYIPQGWSQWYAWEWGEAAAGARALRAGGAGARALVAALYGARAGHGADRAALRALHRAALPDAALAHHWRPPGLPLRLPLHRTLQDYASSFEALPQIDPPQLLGLPANCRIAWERNAANDIIGGLKEIDTNAMTQQENKNNVTPLKMILSLWKKLMAGSPLLKSDYKIEKQTGGWWGGACACEALDAAAAARALHAALAALARAAARAPPLHKVPEEWQSLWAGPEWPEAYLREFCHRAHAAVARVSEDFSDDYLPKEVNFQDWLRPSRVIWALRARTAAALSCAPHSLALNAKWDSTECGAGGVVARGLVLAGAAWRGALGPPAAAAPPHAPAPPILLRFAPESGTEVSPSGTAEVWVYSSGNRAEAVTRLRAPLAPGLDADAAALYAVALLVAPLA